MEIYRLAHSEPEGSTLSESSIHNHDLRTEDGH